MRVLCTSREISDTIVYTTNEDICTELCGPPGVPGTMSVPQLKCITILIRYDDKTTRQVSRLYARCVAIKHASKISAQKLQMSP